MYDICSINYAVNPILGVNDGYNLHFNLFCR